MSEDFESISEDVKEEDSGQFACLCDGFECALNFLANALDDVLSIKNELNEHFLPSNLLLTLSLITAQLQRAMIDMSLQGKELIRLVRLYSTPWKDKSEALKQLHKDYQKKQHKLDVALQKCAVLDNRVQQLERDKVAMNWEKMFMKLHSTAPAAVGWKYAVRQLRENPSSRGDIAQLVSGLDEDEEEEEYRDDVSRSRNVDFEDFSEADSLNCSMSIISDDLVKADNQSATNRASPASNSLPAGEYSKENSVLTWMSHSGKTRGRIEGSPTTDMQEDASDFDDFVNDLPAAKTEALSALDTNNQQRQQHTKVNMQSGTDILSSNEAFLQAMLTPKQTVHKSTWTGETNYDVYLVLLISKPKCQGLVNHWYTVALNDKVYKTEPNIVSGENDVNVNESAGNEMLVLEFPYDHSDVLKSSQFQNSVIRISVHPDVNKSMIAMLSVNMPKLQAHILEDSFACVEGIKDLNGKFLELPQDELDLLATTQSKSIRFNEVCGTVTLTTAFAKIPRMSDVDKCVGTVSLDDLFQELLLERPNYQLVNDRRTISESDASMSELNRIEYEDYLYETLKETSDAAFVDVATSPLFCKTPSLLNADKELTSQTLDNANLKKTKSGSPNSRPKSKKYGRGIPDDFFLRLSMFQEASGQYHHSLKKKVKDETERKIMKKIQAEHKDAKDEQQLSLYAKDVYLPALFMPIKQKSGRPFKARSYLSNLVSSESKIPGIKMFPPLQDNPVAKSEKI